MANLGKKMLTNVSVPNKNSRKCNNSQNNPDHEHNYVHVDHNADMFIWKENNQHPHPFICYLLMYLDNMDVLVFEIYWREIEKSEYIVWCKQEINYLSPICFTPICIWKKSYQIISLASITIIIPYLKFQS